MRLDVLGRLQPDEVGAVAMLAERATEADGARPLSEHVTLRLRADGAPHDRHLLLWADAGADGRLAGYAHLDRSDDAEGPTAELVVDPAYRRQGLGALMVDRMLAESADGRLRLWAHGEASPAGRLARSLGFARVRVLWQMRRSLYAPLPRVGLPHGVALRAFRPGADDAAWLALNARAFADLPDQGGWTAEDLHRRLAQPWVDLDGFLVAEAGGEAGTGGDAGAAGEGPGAARMVGFHWTKVHAEGDGAGPPAHLGVPRGQRAIGEVYVVGVDPDWSGRGLGRALTVAGLRHLRAAGLPAAMLYVDAANTRAIRVYESLGFTRWDTDVLYRR